MDYLLNVYIVRNNGKEQETHRKVDKQAPYRKNKHQNHTYQNIPI